MNRKVSLTAIVITKNEEGHIAECLATLQWADEMLVVDSFSTDNTKAVAEKLGARVLQHPFADFASQRNYAQAQAQHDWVLFVDADERVTERLRTGIENLLESGEIDHANAYYISRSNLFSGRWIGHSPDTFVFTDDLKRKVHIGAQRLMNRTKAVWHREIHEVIDVPEPSGFLDGLMLHYSITNISRALEPLNDYTNREAKLRAQAMRKPKSIFYALFRGLIKFLHSYVSTGLWRYSEQGLFLSILSGFSRFIDYAKAAERVRIAQNMGIWTDEDRKLIESHEVR